MRFRRLVLILFVALVGRVEPAVRRDHPDGRQGHPPGHGRHRSHGVRRHPRRGIQGQYPRRPRERHRSAPQPDPRQARRRSAGQHRRHRRHERQPGLRGRQADRRGLVRARQLFEGADRRHHADCRDDRLHDLRRRAPAGRPRQGRVPAHPREPVRRVSQGAGLEPAVRRASERHRACAGSPRSPGSAAASSARCCGRLRRRS